MRAQTSAGPNARTHRASTTAESTPPLMPTTAPRRRRVWRTWRRKASTIRSVSAAGSRSRICLLNFIRCCVLTQIRPDANLNLVLVGYRGGNFETFHELAGQQLGGEKARPGPFLWFPQWDPPPQFRAPPV